MIDVHYIKQHIIRNPELIELLLDKAGFTHITSNGDEYRCARDEGTNPTSIRIKKSTLFAQAFSLNIKGDIITLIQEKKDLNFSDTLKYICSTLGLSNENVKQKEIRRPFGAYYTKIGANKEYYEKLEAINESVLDNYSKLPNRLFFKDGISAKTQLKYEIGYDSISGRITIPHRSTKGELVGVVGRLNKEEIPDDELRYYPIIPFPKSKTLFGYDKNYATIQEKEMVILNESEKSVMKLDEMGIGVGLAVGGSFISQTQANNINALNPKTIIVAFDEGLDIENLIEDCKKLKINNSFIKNKVGVIWDGKSEILKKGSKNAPADMTRKELNYLIKNCMIWI